MNTATTGLLGAGLPWLVFGCTLFTTAVLTPRVIWLARRIGAVDTGGHRKVHQGATPLLGGLAIAIPVMTAWVAASIGGFLAIHHWEWVYRNHPEWLEPLLELAQVRQNLVVFTIGGVAIIILGIVDDIRGLRPRTKLLGQIIIATFVCASGYTISGINIPLFGTITMGPSLGFVVCVIWIVGLINAFNLIDGVDGLATGIALIACAAMAAIGVIVGDTFPILICMLLAGSLLAFLAFNSYPARIFLGDTGSMFLGFVLASTALMTGQRSGAAFVIMAPLLALSFPIYEASISMVRRYVSGVPIFSGDSGHTHHRLLLMGYSDRKVVLTLYSVAFLLGGTAVLNQLIPQESRWTWVPLALAVTTILSIASLAEYLRPTSFGQLFRERKRNTILGALAKYASLSLGASTDYIERGNAILDLCRKEMRLCFLAAWFETDERPIGSSGAPVSSNPQSHHCDLVEKVRFRSASGYGVLVRYQFDHESKESEKRAVLGCLARIFESAKIIPTSATVVSISDEEDQDDRKQRNTPVGRRQ